MGSRDSICVRDESTQLWIYDHNGAYDAATAIQSTVKAWLRGKNPPQHSSGGMILYDVPVLSKLIICLFLSKEQIHDELKQNGITEPPFDDTYLASVHQQIACYCLNGKKKSDEDLRRSNQSRSTRRSRNMLIDR